MNSPQQKCLSVIDLDTTETNKDCLIRQFLCLVFLLVGISALKRSIFLAPRTPTLLPRAEKIKISEISTKFCLINRVFTRQETVVEPDIKYMSGSKGLSQTYFRSGVLNGCYEARLALPRLEKSLRLFFKSVFAPFPKVIRSGLNGVSERDV